MTISYLPVDLVEEILSSVPVKALLRLRSTCKRWNALFKDPKFIEKNSRKATKQSLVLMLKDYKVRPMMFNLNVDAPPSIEFKGELSVKDPHSSNVDELYITDVFHCDGLLLCTTKNNSELVVWNPSSGETRCIQFKTYKERDPSRFALGYQNNESCRSYKILRWWDRDNSPQNQLVEIYEFSSDSWKVLDNMFPYCSIDGKSVSLKGNLYRLACHRSVTCILLSFDFATESFKLLSLHVPPGNLNPKTNKMVLSVVKEEKLSVLHQNDMTLKTEIWMTNIIDSQADLSWRKIFTVDLKTRVPCRSFLIDEEKKVAVCHFLTSVRFVGEDDACYVESLPWCKNWYCSSDMFEYVPSLVQIKRD